MKFLRKNVKVIVRSRISEKELLRPVSWYIEGEVYSNFASFLEKKERDFKRQGFHYSLKEITEDKSVFDKFIKKFVHPNYSITFDEIETPIYVLNGLKKNSPIFIVPEGKPVPQPTLKFVNDILSTYGNVNNKPKYEAKAIKPMTSNIEKSQSIKSMNG